MFTIPASRAAFRRPCAKPSLYPAIRSLVGSQRRMSTMHDNDPETLETEKQRNLSKQQHKTSTPHHKNAPGWNEKLASTSEAYVKADKSDSVTPNQLQEETVEYVTARYAPDDRMSPTTAFYSRDEVSGPLGTAAGKENGVNETVVKKVTTRMTEQVVEEKTPTG